MTAQGAVRTAAIAAELIAAYDAGSMVDRIDERESGFDAALAYDVLHVIELERHTRGWRPVGRKIGFTNQSIWARYGVSAPMWARMWDRTVRFTAGAAVVELAPFVQPRIEPEVVFGLSAPPPAGGDPEALLACVEWMAGGFEIVQCHFPEWRFSGAECTAAFGLHGMLVVGEPAPIRDRDVAALSDTLATFTVTLSRDGSRVEQGTGANVLGSPALALDYLVHLIAGQDQFDSLAAGEVITTGTLTDAQPIASGERWTSDYGALDVRGLDVTFA